MVISSNIISFVTTIAYTGFIIYFLMIFIRAVIGGKW